MSAHAIAPTDATATDAADDSEPVALVSAAPPRRKAAMALPDMTFNEMLAMGEHLVRTGFLPRHVKTGAQAAAIMLAGRELGMLPMRALRSLMMVEGKIVESADSQLGRFKVAGGQAKFLKLDMEEARLWLRHPNGDEHVEVYTHDDVVAAGLDRPTMNGAKSNHLKHPKAMKRSRCITAGLKSIGWDGGVDVYDAEELPDLMDEHTAEPVNVHAPVQSGELPPMPPLRSLGGRPVSQEVKPDPSTTPPPPPADADSEPATEKQRALLAKLMTSHVFTDLERSAAAEIITKKRMSRAIEYAQSQLVLRREAERIAKKESDARVQRGVQAALHEDEPELFDDNDRVQPDALRNGH